MNAWNPPSISARMPAVPSGPVVANRRARQVLAPARSGRFSLGVARDALSTGRRAVGHRVRIADRLRNAEYGRHANRGNNLTAEGPESDCKPPRYPGMTTELHSLLIWTVGGAAVVSGALAAVVVVRGRPIPGEHVFRASRWSRGNHLFPTQVAIIADEVVQYTCPAGSAGGNIRSTWHTSPRWTIDTNLFFSNVVIETSGGSDPVRCHGHRKRDAIEMKRLINEYQSAYYTTAVPRRDVTPTTCSRAGPIPQKCAAKFNGPGAVAAARRYPALPLRPAGRDLRRRSADADVRADAARRRELRPRAGRIRHHARK